MSNWILSHNKKQKNKYIKLSNILSYDPIYLKHNDTFNFFYINLLNEQINIISKWRILQKQCCNFQKSIESYRYENLLWRKYYTKKKSIKNIKLNLYNNYPIKLENHNHF